MIRSGDSKSLVMTVTIRFETLYRSLLSIDRCRWQVILPQRGGHLHSNGRIRVSCCRNYEKTGCFPAQSATFAVSKASTGNHRVVPLHLDVRRARKDHCSSMFQRTSAFCRHSGAPVWRCLDLPARIDFRNPELLFSIEE
jgi:hypothetical protein